MELRIFEGDAKTDITFSYNANFFLFATLETARPICHGRVQPSPQQIPVLTGMPVSGMAYLDRPSEAGYFIFPDLSVRHEGRYKLSFNLYEETKDEKDTDAEQSIENQSKPSLIGATPNGSFDWRLEVKSAAFTVYSAKKFPGLAESTVLSRTVAEQGCRVRIRRDVRMRRREGKTAGDFEEFEEDYSGVRRTGTPDSVHESYVRQRSLSNSPVDRQPYAPEPSGPAGYLNFGNSAGQQYQTPQFSQPAPPQPLQAQQSYPSAQPSFNQPPPPRPPTDNLPYQSTPITLNDSHTIHSTPLIATTTIRATGGLPSLTRRLFLRQLVIHIPRVTKTIIEISLSLPTRSIHLEPIRPAMSVSLP